MKHILRIAMLAAVLPVIATVTSCKSESYSHDAEGLPKNAQAVLANNFESEVATVKVEKSVTGVDDYEVTLQDGSEITFDTAGNWQKVKTVGEDSVPQYFLMPSMISYLSANQPGLAVKEIEVTKTGYELTLANGLQAEFDTAGKFVRYEN